MDCELRYQYHSASVLLQGCSYQDICHSENGNQSLSMMKRNFWTIIIVSIIKVAEHCFFFTRALKLQETIKRQLICSIPVPCVNFLLKIAQVCCLTLWSSVRMVHKKKSRCKIILQEFCLFFLPLIAVRTELNVAQIVQFNTKLRIDELLTISTILDLFHSASVKLSPSPGPSCSKGG